MRRRGRRAVAAALLLALPMTLPGCMIAIGSRLPSDPGERMQRLEKRVKAAEEKLGLPAEGVPE